MSLTTPARIALFFRSPLLCTLVPLAFAQTAAAQTQGAAQRRLARGPPAVNVVDRDSGLRFLLAGRVGKLQAVYVSSSSVPSTGPYVSLAIGNHFTDLFPAGTFVIPPSGWLQVDVPPSALGDPGLAGLVFYSQAVEFTFPRPLPVSNLQSILLVQ